VEEFTLKWTKRRIAMNFLRCFSNCLPGFIEFLQYIYIYIYIERERESCFAIYYLVAFTHFLNNAEVCRVCILSRTFNTFITTVAPFQAELYHYRLPAGFRMLKQVVDGTSSSGEEESAMNPFAEVD
jgi:hypothetical protein